MTTPAPRIRILAEQVRTFNPTASASVRTVAITYQLPPRPANVVFVTEADLPDLVYLREHPAQEFAPEAIQAQGDAVRRDRILAHSRANPTRPVRVV